MVRDQKLWDRRPAAICSKGKTAKSRHLCDESFPSALSFSEEFRANNVERSTLRNNEQCHAGACLLSSEGRSGLIDGRS